MDVNGSDLARLIRRATDENASPAARNRAFGVLVARHQDAALKAARAILSDPQAAEDAAQEAFLTAWRSLENLRDPDAFPAWLRRIVRTHCSRQVRGLRPRFVPLEERTAGAGGPCPEAALARKETHAAVREALAALPAREREAAQRYYLDEDPQVEIAAALGVPATTIKKRVHSARQRLRERLTPLMENEPLFPLAVRLFAAVEDNDAETIRALTAERSALLRRTNAQGETPLRRAAALGHRDAVRALLEAGAPREGALLAAAGVGRIDVVADLLDAGAPIEERDAAGWTPLRRAADAAIPVAEDTGDHWGVCELLLARGAALDPYSAAALDRLNRPPAPLPDGLLHVAARGGWKKAVRTLLDAGADVHAKDDTGRTPLDWALQPGRTRALPPHGAAAALLRAAGALSASSLAPPPPPAEEPFPDLAALETLLASDPEAIRRRDAVRQTLLHRAAAAGEEEAIARLLSRGASVRALAADGATPLHRAVRQGRTGAAERLLDAGADARAWDHAGRSPLFEVRDGALARRLLGAGADPNAVGPGRATALHAAVERGQREVVQALLDAGADPNARNYFGATPLLVAAREGQAELLSILRAAGAELHARDDWHRSLLHIAAWFGQAEVARWALSAGMYHHDLAYGFSTPLHTAAGAGQIEVAQVFLDAGADIQNRTDFGRTPLHDAVHGGHAEMTRFLLDAGADPSVRNTRGATPLHWAAASGNAEIVALLRERGADREARTQKGETPRALAERHGHAQVAALLAAP